MAPLFQLVSAQLTDKGAQVPIPVPPAAKPGPARPPKH
jgi:hypothetical protein